MSAETGAWLRHVVTRDEAGRTVGEVAAAWLGLSPGALRDLARRGGVRLDRRGASLGRTVRAGDVLAVLPEGASASPGGPEPVAVELDVVHEDDSLVVIDKPPGMLVHPVARDDLRTVVNGLAHRFRQRGGPAAVHPVHRLDRDTSGLVVVARSPHAHRHLDRQLRDRTLRREYLALVHGIPRDDTGEIDAPLGRDPASPSRRAVVPGGDPARTRYRVEERYPEVALLRLELETGRTHQIRVHLEHRGHPVLGDRTYGRRGMEEIARQALHAARLSLLHPATGEPLVLESPLPADMARLRERLRAGTAG